MCMLYVCEHARALRFPTSGSLSQSESQYDTPKVEPSGDVSASLVVPLVKLVVDSVDQ